MESRLPITAKHNDSETITSLASTAARIKRVEKRQAGVQHRREKETNSKEIILQWASTVKLF